MDLSVTSAEKKFNRARKSEPTTMLSAVQYMSDLHLERIKYEFTITKVAPILLLAGDVGRFVDGKAYQDFLVKQSEQFDLVLLVAGNHEFYGCTYSEGLRIAQSFVDNPAMSGRLRFLRRTRLDLPGSEITILGCTLQSYIAPNYTKLTNDFQRIKNWSVRDHNEEHQRDLAWLESAIMELSQTKRRIIIVTHYAPAFEDTCHPLNENNAVSQCFSSRALQQMLTWPGAQLTSHWVFGHTHWNTKFKSGGVTVLSNQLCNDSKNLTWWQRRTLYRAFNMEATIRLYK